MSTLSQTLLGYMPRDPLLGGALSTGPTALPRPMGLPGIGASALADLPYTRPITSLASQVPVGAGRQAATSALGLGQQAAGRGVLSRLPSMGGLIQGGSAASRLGAGVGGLGFGVAGAVGSHVIDRLNPGGQNSNLEQGLQGAATGAGIGAGLGLLGGPLAPLTSSAGALIGGVAGGALGVLGNIFGGGGGEDEPESTPLDILGNAITAAGLTPDQTEEVLQTYEVMTALAESAEEGEARDAAMAQAYDAAAQMVLQKMQEKEMVAGLGGGNMLALQAQAQDIFAPVAQNTEDAGRMYAAALQGSMADLPPEYRAIAQNTATRELSSSQRLADAYRAQAAVIPAISQLTQYQNDYNALAAQMFQQATQQQMGGGQQTADVAALLTAGI